MKYCYTFKEQNGIYELTGKAEFNPYNIEKILGKVKVKGKRQDYELIYIKSEYPRIYDGIVLTERKNLTFKVVTFFIRTCWYCERSVEHRPYYNDLKDKELLNDLDIEVLTYQRYWESEKCITTCFYPCKRDEITEELKTELEERTKCAKEQLEDFKRFRKSIEQMTFEPI